MQQDVQEGSGSVVIRFLDVSKTYRYHGARRALEAESEEEDEDGEEEEDDDGEANKFGLGETHVALKDVSFAIEAGDRVGIIGRNGAGKSTLLNIIAGMSHPTTGRVVGRGSVIPLAHMMRPLNKDWNGLQNLRVLAQFLGFPIELVNQRQADIARFAGMERAILQPVSTYSKNMYARLAFAAALELDGDIYISDDFLGVGDQAYQAKCFNRLLSLCKEGKTLLFATHKLKLIKEICNRVIWLESGKLIADGDPGHVVAGYTVEDLPTDDLDEIASASDLVGVTTPTEENQGLPDAWVFKADGQSHPLPPTVIHAPTLVAVNDALSEETPNVIGGIVDLNLIGNANPHVVENNQPATIACGLKLPHEAELEIMVEISRDKILLYRSFLQQPFSAIAPQLLNVNISVPSDRLPDGVYRIEIHTCIKRLDGSPGLISRGELYIATRNCGPSPSPREKNFVVTAMQNRPALLEIELTYDALVLETAPS